VLIMSQTLSGRQWNIEKNVDPIWPDSEIVIPFLRRLIEDPISAEPHRIINSSTEVFSEGGVKVRHTLNQLQLFHLNQDGKAPVEIADLRGVWVEGPPGPDKTSLPVAQLHVPGADPFEWLSAHSELTDDVTVEPGEVIDQGFLIGANEIAIQVARRFGNVVISATKEMSFDLIAISPIVFGSRLLIGRRVDISLSHAGSDYAGPPLPLLVRRLELLIPIDIPPKIIAPSGFAISVSDGGPLDVVGQGLRLFVVGISRSDGALFSAVSVRMSSENESVCLWKVRYYLESRENADWRERVILSPGKYQLKLAGSSNWWSARGGPSKGGAWSKEVLFSIDFPDHLRPYMMTTTIGDNRIMNPKDDPWNPSPFGRGLPLYADLLGVVQSKVPYLEKIYRSLNVTVSRSHAGAPKTVPSSLGPNLFNESADNPASAKWKSGLGIPGSIASELRLQGPFEPGLNTLSISFDDPFNSGRTLKLDEWEFESSRFSSFSQHLAFSSTGIHAAFDEFGPVALPSLPDLTAYPDPHMVGDAQPGSEKWLLPLPMASLAQPIDTGTHDRFIKLAARLNCKVKSGATHSLELFFEPVAASQIAVMLDPTGAGHVMWMRTAEPLDWRRTSGSFLYRSLASDPSKAVDATKFDLFFVPSFDGSSAFLFAAAGGRFVRLPKGLYDVSLSYSLVQAGLPSNRRSSGDDSTPMRTSFRIVNPFGSEWPKV
jgi:hypothetical protein